MHYSQEYLCLARESFEEPLHVYLNYGKEFKDITKLHCFVGYSPLIFAFPSSIFSDISQNFQLIFTSIKQNDNLNLKDAVAILSLQKIKQQNINENIVLLYEGVKGNHRFTSLLQQYIFQLSNKLYGEKPGNIFLQGNLYDQVQIAYALPRKICLITVEENNLFNLFPTDLHGQIDEEYYIISLRSEGNACRQVESSGKIALSDMNPSACKEVYSLGKNHMQPLKKKSSFDFSSSHSKNFELPLPNGAVAYKELELQSSFVYGIHKLLLFKIIFTGQIIKTPETLAHIHNSYATWRYKQGLPGNYLLR